MLALWSMWPHLKPWLSDRLLPLLKPRPSKSIKLNALQNSTTICSPTTTTTTTTATTTTTTITNKTDIAMLPITCCCLFTIICVHTPKDGITIKATDPKSFLWMDFTFNSNLSQVAPFPHLSALNGRMHAARQSCAQDCTVNAKSSFMQHASPIQNIIHIYVPCTLSIVHWHCGTFPCTKIYQPTVDANSSYKQHVSPIPNIL